MKEGRTRAENALGQAKATKTAEEFGLLAEKISDDDYRVMMGQHKPVPVDQLAPQVVKALIAMKPDDVSGVIQIEQAYTIVRLQEHTPAGKAKFEEVRAQLEKGTSTEQDEPASRRAGSRSCGRTRRSKRCKRAREPDSRGLNGRCFRNRWIEKESTREA